MKPCPFCEVSDEYLRIVPAWNVGAVESYAIVCDNCSARGPIGRDKDQVVERWNWACRWEEVQELVESVQEAQRILMEGLGYDSNPNLIHVCEHILADALAPFEANDD